MKVAVRDYECDLAGMVNNASYLNYIEHARHEFLRSKGIDFAGLAREGIYLVVIRIELDFLYSLRSGDRFAIGTNLERVSRLRLAGLARDDGLPPVHSLPTGSPAVDSGSRSTCPPTDQLGLSRPVDGDCHGSALCDMGAFVYQ